ncbi:MULTISPECIES: hypothetical protein [unclassified Aeromicrobium]|uniref:hypothetical protein n=1 Tax=unclassified Aeromicrobium TaxID=2633570 RepID=UPI00288A8F9E|nr:MULTISPECIES: hypothetical protein [unclassified Aeromicrobium]
MADAYLERLEGAERDAMRRASAPRDVVPEEYWQDYPPCKRFGCTQLGEVGGFCPDHAPAHVMQEYLP